MPKQPQDNAAKYGFGKKRSPFVDLKLPSGNLVQVRRPDPQSLIRDGLLDELDSLTGAVVTETIPVAEGKAVAKAAPKFDREQVAKSLNAMDRIVVAVVAQPTVVLDEQQAEADESVFWIGDVDLQDKTFIVKHAAGGGSDLDTFRKESEETLGSVPTGT